MTKGSKPIATQLRLGGPVIVIKRGVEKKQKKTAEKPLGTSQLSLDLAAAIQQELKENGSDGRLTLTNTWRRVKRESE